MLALFLPLAACGDTPAAGFLSAATGSFRGTPPPVTREAADASPFASILVTIGGSTPALVVLHSALGSDRIWVAADRVALATSFGRIVGSAGLPGGLTAIRPSPEDWLIRPGPPPTQSLLSIDGPEPIGFGMVARCTVAALGPSQIVILGRAYPTELIEERCRPETGSPFTNRFWRDAEGQVWRSEQWLGSGPGVVTVEVLKPTT